MADYNGVIDTATGDLLRSGFCDFSADGSFNGATETYKARMPFPGETRDPDTNRLSEMMSRWNGSAWVRVAQPS